MPSGRLRRGEAEKREQFMESLFKQNPDMSAAKANDEFLKQFGSRMRYKGVYTIRAKVQAQEAIRKGVIQPEPPRPRIVTEETKPTILVTGTPSQMQFLSKTLEELNNKGLVGLKVDHATDAYMVVTKS